jgi:hypothetical protein
MSVALQGSLWRPGLPPGVYEETPAVARRARVRLDVAALIGLAERGPVNTPVAVEDPGQFSTRFGRDLPGLNLPQAVRLFFANGGRRCVVMRCLDHANAATTRLTLPGLAVQLGASWEPVPVAARNPGRWGDRLSLRCRILRRPAPITLGAGSGGTPRLLAADPRVVAGATLQLTGHPPGAGAPPGLQPFRVHQVAADASGARELRLDRTPDEEFLDASLLRAAVELTLTVTVELDGREVERWEDAALHPAHPRFLPRLIGRRAASEALRPPPTVHPDPEDPGAEADRLWGGIDDPWGSEYLRPSARLTHAWLRPGEELLAAPDGVWASLAEMPGAAPGRDATATTGRRHFFDPTEVTLAQIAADGGDRLLVFGDRPGALDALAGWDQAFPQEPVALVTLPDLLHPSPPPAQADPPPATDDTPCFRTRCIPGTGETTLPALDYPLLGFDAEDLSKAQGRVKDHCESVGGRIAMLDLPPRLRANEIVPWRQALASDRAALYAPWLRVAAADVAIEVPPAAAACGITALVERLTGVWAAPANRPVDAAFARADDPGLPEPGFLHAERIDEIRRTERGLMLLGARTTSNDPDWTHISVRRLIDWLQAQLALDLAWAPFEPNDAPLWQAMAGTGRRRLQALFDAGALAGRTAAEAYFVRCDAGTNTPVDLDAGRAVMLIGVAPAVPAEFIVFRLLRHGADDPRLEVQ